MFDWPPMMMTSTGVFVVALEEEPAHPIKEKQRGSKLINRMFFRMETLYYRPV